MGKARSLSRRRAQSGALVDTRNELWQPPPLTASERAYMIRKAKEASVALVDHAHTLDGPVQWHYTGKYRGIQMYRGEGSYDNVGTTGTEFLCGVTTMIGAIEEVASYFDQQTTEDMVAKKAEDVIDCGVLYSLVYGDPKNLFYRVSAKYQLYEGPSAFSRDRDYCFLECQNTFRHASGRRGWVLSMHSIKLPSCPEVEGVVRGSMYQSGYVFVEAEKDGYMDVMHSLQINFKSSSRLPHFMLNSALKQRILSVVTISREIQTSRMGRQTLLRKKDLMPKRTRALCANCSRKFSLFVRKTRCRVCGEVVCHPCAPQVTISTARGLAKTRVCTKCYNTSPSEEYEPDHGNSRRMQNNTRYSDILQNHDEHPDFYQEEDEDNMDEDGGEDGLEEQSDYSVFAQSRFTDASRDSMAASHFNASKYQFDTQFDGSSQFDASSEMDESQYYDGGSSESSYISDGSGTSSSYWDGDSTSASNAAWHRVKPTNSNSYDSQASRTSTNMNRSRDHGSDFGASHADRRKQRYNAAPILEDEPSSHRGNTGRPEASYDDYSSTQSTNHHSSQVSDFKASKSSHGVNEFKASNDLKSSQESQSSSSQGSQYSDSSQGSKTVSIQTLAKARSARYGIKSQFPSPPPPPLSSPPEEEDEDHNPLRLHTGGLNKSKNRSLKGNAARKVFTPPPSKASQSSNRGFKESRRIAFNAAKTSRDSLSSYTSSRDSMRSTTRSSAILEHVRLNRVRTLQFVPNNDRSSSVIKSLEQEHLKRMCEIEEQAKERAARRSMAMRASLKRGVQSDRGSRTIKKEFEQDRLSTRRSRAVSRASSVMPPGSPPGTPPSMRNRPLPSPGSLLKSQANLSLRENRSQLTDVSKIFSDSHIQQKCGDVDSGARKSFVPSAKGRRLTQNSQRSGRQFDASQASNFASTFNGKRLNASIAPNASGSSHRGNRAVNVSQLSVDRFKCSSSIAILENPNESPEFVTMVERPSLQSSLGDSLLNEDVLAQSSGLAEHINSIRARAAYRLPDEENRQSVELQMRQNEHRKRMKELSKLSTNHGMTDSIRDSTSTLGGLHDSSVGRKDYFQSDLGASPASSASSVNIDDEDFDFKCRPLRRIKRSGTIPFALEETEQGLDTESDDDDQSEGLDDSESSFRVSEKTADHTKPSFRSSEESARVEQGDEPQSPTSCQSDRDIKQKTGSVISSFRSNEIIKRKYDGKSLSPRQSSESVQLKDDVDTLAFRPSEESVENEYQLKSGPMTPPRPSKEHGKKFATPPRRQSDEYVRRKMESATEFSALSRRLNETDQDEYATFSRRSSELSVESDQKQRRGFVTPPRRRSSDSVKPDRKLSAFAYRSNMGSAKHASEEQEISCELVLPHRSNYSSGFTTPPRRQSMTSGSEFGTSPRHSSEGRKRTSPRRGSDEIVEREPEQRPHLQSKESLILNYESELANSAHRLSEASDEHELRSRSRQFTPSCLSSENHSRLSEESVKLDYSAHRSNEENPVYKSREDSMKHKSERESVSSCESEPEDADSVIRLSEEKVAQGTIALKAQLFSSQLITGEGDTAVDTFFASNYSALSMSKQLAQVNEHEEDTRSPRETSDLHQISDKSQTKAPVYYGCNLSDHLASSRDSNASSLDEELTNRPTIELFDMIQANRPKHRKNGFDSSEKMHKLEASHLRRMEELNRIALDQLGDRISNFDEDMLGSAYQPGRSMHPGLRSEGNEIQWRSSSVMQEVKSKHQIDMETLRRRIRQLEEECRESIASVLTPEEMDLSELDSDDDMPYGHQSLNGQRSHNLQSSFMCASDLSASTISEHASDDGSEHHQPLPARILFERIAQLKLLQSAMAEAENENDDEKHHDRIKEHYRMLRSIKANGARHERESLSRESLSDENWI